MKIHKPIIILVLSLFCCPIAAYAEESHSAVLDVPRKASPLEPKSPSSQKRSDKTITLDVKTMDVVDVMKILADRGGLNISVSADIRARVTLFLKDIDLWDAFEVVIASADLAYESKGDIIYVMSAKDYQSKYGRDYWETRSLRIFSSKHAKAARLGAVLSQIASKVGKVIVDDASNTVVVLDTQEKLKQMDGVVAKLDREVVTRLFELNYAQVEDFEKRISAVVSKEVGSVKIDVSTNKVMVSDYPEKIAEVEKLIAAFDEKPLQVLINAKIIELKPSKKFAAGINWDYWINKYFRVKGDFSLPAPSGISDKVRFGTIGTAEPSGRGDYNAVIDFLEIFGETKILSSPRILALNNQEAKILVGTKDAYITSTVSELGDSAVTTQTVNFVDVGVKLYVTPTINKQDYVTLKIRPEISSSERETITTEDKSTEVPIVTTSQAETTVIVKDGVSVIIGGLRKITRQKETKGVPILSKIPLLGWLFRSTSDDWSKDELVIVLTPQIVSGDRSIEEELKGKLYGETGESEVLADFIEEGKKKGCRERAEAAQLAKETEKDERVREIERKRYQKMKRQTDKQ